MLPLQKHHTEISDDKNILGVSNVNEAVLV